MSLVGNREYSALLAMALACACGEAAAATIIVNSTTDNVGNDGQCTLREALNSAANDVTSGGMGGECAAGEAAPNVDTIQFAIPDSDSGCVVGTPTVCTIAPGTTLPNITGGPVFLDGYHQAGASENTLAVGDNAKLTIVLDATNSGGLRVTGSFNNSVSGSGSTIQGLVITHFSNYGICLSCSFGANASDVTIRGNFIGTDRSGSTTTGTGTAALELVTSSGATIGGTGPGDRNVLASNGGGAGIFLNQSSGATIRGNYVGIDATGTTALAASKGISLEQGSSDDTVGGSAAGAGNVIGAHQSSGIEISAGSNDIVQGNLIGTDATGTFAVGSGGHGIDVASAAADTGNVIGGSGAGEGNLISGGNAGGIAFSGSPHGVLVQGNRIGTDISGNLPLPNAGCGIDVEGSNVTATIGGSGAGEGNIIAFNTTNGVAVFASGTTNVSILGNSIHDNASLGIALTGRCNDLSSQPVANDTNDVDTGPNGKQNYPVIGSVTIASGGTTAAVSGTLNSTENRNFRVELFANARCDDSNPVPSTQLHTGEGKVFLGSTEVMTSGNDGAFAIPNLTVPPDRHVITATATDETTNATSEFSVCSDQDTIFSDGYDGD